MGYLKIWELQEKEKDNIKTFFFNAEISNPKNEINLDLGELSKNRSRNITICESKGHNISENRERERDLNNFFINREIKTLKLLKRK